MSTAATPTEVRPQPRLARLAAAMASRPLALALAITAILTALRLSDTVATDVAWQLWIAGQIHAGASLYRDIVETNPPLWFWMAIPVDRVAALLHLRVESVLIGAIGGSIALALAATNRLLLHIGGPRRTLLLAYAALTLAAMPWVNVGQREQIALIGTLPYAALIAARRKEGHIPALLAALIGAGAGLGFALKHYFLIVPVLLELWLAAGMRRDWRPLRPETLTMVVLGIAYAVAIALLERDFLTIVVPLVRLAYGSLGAPSLRYMFGPFGLVGLATLGVVASQARLLNKAPFATAMLLAGIGFAAAYFIQFKGWIYHALPMLGCASIALAALLTETSAPRLLRLAAPALLALPLYLAVDEQRHPELPNADLLKAISGLKRGDSVGFMTTETALGWSVTLQEGYRYPSRYMGFWMVPAILHNERLGSPDPRLIALGRQIVTETVTDFRCSPPRRIIVWRPRPHENGFDVLPLFLRDPNFASLLAHYRLRDRTSLAAYELATPLAPPATPCRPAV